MRITITHTSHPPKLRLHLTIAAALLVVGLLGVLRVHPAAAQTATRATLSGTIADSSGGRVVSATVVIQRDGSALPLVVATGADGVFTTAPLPAGSYRITVDASGFAPAVVSVVLPLEQPLAIQVNPAPVVEQVRIVSASRQEELRETLNTRVDVITRARIEEGGAQSVGEVLRDVPGIVSRRGSETAGAAGEQIQGIDSRQVQVLLDGQPIAGARGIKRGAVNMDRQSAGRLERVEIVKGAASALYGSEAIGGVINLITREPSLPRELYGEVLGGSNGEMNGRATLAARQERWFALGGLERHKHDGFDLTPTTFDTTGAPFQRVDFNGKVRGQASPSMALSANVAGYHNRTQGRSSGELGPQSDDIGEVAWNAGGAADWMAGASTTVQVRGVRSSYDEESTASLAPPASTPLAPGALEQQFDKLDVSASRVFGGRQQLQAGVEWWHDTYAGLNRLSVDDGVSASTAVGWMQHRWSATDWLVTTVGARLDRHSAFGTALSPKLGATARLGGGMSLRASYGRGFRAPDLGQLYYRFLNPSNLYQVIGNQNLDAEYGDSIQVGAEYAPSHRRVRAGVNVFHNRVSHLIESVSLGFVATPTQLAALLAQDGLDASYRPVLGRLLFTYKNVSDAATRGMEVDGDVALGRGLMAGAAYTYLDARDAVRDVALTGRNSHQGHARLTWRSERVGTTANVRGTFYSSWIAARSTAADVIAPGFALWDVSLSQRVARNVSAALFVDNLMDSQDPNTGVMLPSGAPAAIYRPEVGRTIRVAVRWGWAGQ